MLFPWFSFLQKKLFDLLSHCLYFILPQLLHLYLELFVLLNLLLNGLDLIPNLFEFPIENVAAIRDSFLNLQILFSQLVNRIYLYPSLLLQLLLCLLVLLVLASQDNRLSCARMDVRKMLLGPWRFLPPIIKFGYGRLWVNIVILEFIVRI